MSLDSVNDKTLTNIFAFIGNVPDFCRSAASCRRLRNFLKDDAVWKLCPIDDCDDWDDDWDDWDAYQQTNRSQAFSAHILTSVRQHKEGHHFETNNVANNFGYIEFDGEKSYILKVFGLETWGALVAKIVCKEGLTCTRRDTLIAVARVVEYNMIQLLRAAIMIMLLQSENLEAPEPFRASDLDKAFRVGLPFEQFLHYWLYEDPTHASDRDTDKGTERRLVIHLMRAAGFSFEIEDPDSVAAKICDRLFGLTEWLLDTAFKYEGTAAISPRDINRAASRLQLPFPGVYLSAEDASENDSHHGNDER
ncbi:unknown protein [Seminavis robusta]|uniref:F-box domain-containing protein n=1 Tax=Seminavis robusta TaxID=568900 RepID=A0A9N8E9K9_9STRA|nr:unknown protein [Seminavis robusta]|eukprot:Sro778_g201200.1 n/a (307) ;mRNA; r:35703-36623